MIKLKAIETLAVEHGRVSPGQIFQIKSKEEAAVLIAQGRAEETNEDVDFDNKPQIADSTEDKAVDRPVDPRQRDTKPAKGPTETK